MHRPLRSLVPSFRSLMAGHLWAVGLLVVSLAFVAGPPVAHGQTTYTVTNTNDSGSGSFRAALNNANNGSGTPADVIEFDIAGSGPHTIQLSSALPDVTDPVEIEGATEPDYSGTPVVAIDGQNAGASVSGITVAASEGIVSELAIVNFDGNGLLLDGASSISILSNYIGVAPDGSGAGNGGNGIEIMNGASSNFIDNNVISANSQRGIFIGVGNGANDNIVVGNLIGTNPDGTSDMGNSQEGILANSVTGTRIGVSFTGGIDGNVISGNGRDGIHIVGGDALIRGNYVGTNAAGDAALGNDQNGVKISAGASGVTVGGTTGSGGDDAGNVISGNTENGVLITGSSTSSNIVLGNNIGTNGAGDGLLGNGGDGVAITNGATATIGGTASGAENIIGGNDEGVRIDSKNNTVQGNFIGTNASGADLGNFRGIAISSGSGNMIGGTASGAGNVIGFSNIAAAAVFGSTSQATFHGNFIGITPSGDDIDNGGFGIYITNSSAGNVIGGTASGAGNTIANNGDSGVGLGLAGNGTSIRGNRIFDNTGIGVDLGNDGQTSNDGGDADDGVNRLQNFPEIQGASYDASANKVTVTYFVPSDPNAGGSGASTYDLTVDFYQTDADGKEGEAYLGTDTYTASEYSNCGSSPCTVTTTFTPGASVTQQDSLLATVTDANGNTSEFAASVAGLGPNVFTVTVTGDGADANVGDGTCATSGGDCSLRAALEEANATSNTAAGPDEIHFDVSASASPSSPHVIQPGSELPAITDPVMIDGTTEPDYGSGPDPKPVVEIDGTNAGSSARGIRFEADGNTVRGLAVINFGEGGFYSRLVSTTDQTITGCHVGVRADGTTAAGNGGTGIDLNGDDQIGGPGADEGNIIGANGMDGLFVASNTTVQGNFIGTNPGGKDLGNGIGGVLIRSNGTTVGGTASGEGNVIAFNTDNGVSIINAETGITVRGNRIFDNGNLGIDLAGNGTTSNDAGDADDGSNRLQNFPEIQGASYDAGANEVTVTYQVPSDPNAGGSGASAYDLTIDFYRADAAQEEGEAYLGTDTYTTSDYNTSTSGPEPKTVTFTPAASVTESDHIVTTATDANGNTSEFSAQSQQLPVELVGFEAQQSSTGAVRLTWKTASEQNNAGFAVQHQSSSSDTWTKLGFVESKVPGGTTADPEGARDYRYSAEDLSVGTHRFRLKQVDLDGSTTFTDPVTVDLQMDESLQLSAPAPNPIREQATLSFAVKKEALTVVTLYNVLGQQVQTLYDGRPTAGDAQRVRLDASGLSSGVYIVRLKALGDTRTRRVTVVR